jgi:hypothetical protein
MNRRSRLTGPGPQRRGALDHPVHRPAVARLRAEGQEIRDEDITRLSPLKHRNLNILGRFSFTASTPAGGALLRLRAPHTVELDEDDEG